MPKEKQARPMSKNTPMSLKQLLDSFKEKFAKEFRKSYEGILPEEEIEGSISWHEEFVGGFLRLAILQALEAVKLEKGKAPMKLMQDGMSMDYSFREGWNAAASEVERRIEEMMK